MSRAFIREDDDAELEVLPPLASLVPPGVKNYLTAAGAERLRTEVARMHEVERPRLVVAALTDAEAKHALALLDQRVRYLQQSLATAEVVVPAATAPEQVTFGATVTVRDRRGVESVYRLVGVDEADFARHEVSWLAPVARALMHARIGQRVPFKFPSGATDLEIVKIA